MDTLPDAILFHCVFPALDCVFLWECDTLRLVCRRLNAAVGRYWRLVRDHRSAYLRSPQCLEILQQSCMAGKSQCLLYTSQLTTVFDGLNKSSIGELYDYINQRNLSLIDPTALVVLKAVMRLFDYKANWGNKAKGSRTLAKIERMNGFARYLEDFWRFKNQFARWEVIRIPQPKVKQLRKSLKNIDLSRTAVDLPVLTCLTSYISLVLEYSNYSKRQQVASGQYIDSELTEEFLLSLVNKRLKYWKAVGTQ